MSEAGEKILGSIRHARAVLRETENRKDFSCTPAPGSVKAKPGEEAAPASFEAQPTTGGMKAKPPQPGEPRLRLAVSK